MVDGDPTMDDLRSEPGPVWEGAVVDGEPTKDNLKSERGPVGANLHRREVGASCASSSPARSPNGGPVSDSCSSQLSAICVATPLAEIPADAYKILRNSEATGVLFDTLLPENTYSKGDLGNLARALERVASSVQRADGLTGLTENRAGSATRFSHPRVRSISF